MFVLYFEVSPSYFFLNRFPTSTRFIEMAKLLLRFQLLWLTYPIGLNCYTSDSLIDLSNERQVA